MTTRPQLPAGAVSARSLDPKAPGGFWGWVLAHLPGIQQGYLGPGVPLAPVLPQSPEEQAAPRGWEYAPNQNTSTTPRGESAALTPFAQLRALASTFDVAALCIKLLCDEIQSLDWTVVPVDSADKDAPTRLADRIARVTDALAYPDPDAPLLTLPAWMAKLLREDLEIGWPAIWVAPTRGKGIYGLQIIQGDTIKPILGLRGQVLAYQQVWEGLTAQTYAPTDLIVSPYLQRANQAYGIAPMELILLTVNRALRRQSFDLSYYQEGNTPEGLVGAPPGYQPEQIRKLQEYWDTLVAGNDKERRRMHIWPSEGLEHVYEFKKQDPTLTAEEFLLKITAAAFGPRPEELGFTAHVNRATAEQQSDSQQRTAVRPRAMHLEAVMTWIIQRKYGAKELRFAFDLGGKKEDRAQQADIDDKNIKNQIYSAYYVRDRDNIKLSPDDPLLAQQNTAAPVPGLPAGAPAPTVAPEAEEPPMSDDTAPEAEAPDENAPAGGNVLLLYAAATLRKVRALNSALNALAKAGGPGSHGGHYWIDAKGKVRYGTPPKGTSERAKRGQERKARAASRHQAAVARHAAVAARKAEHHRQVLARQNGRDELHGLADLTEMRGKGWGVLDEAGHGEGPDGRSAANAAAQAAGGKDPSKLFAVVKVNGTYYVVSKPIASLQQERSGGSKARNVVSGGSHKTREATVRGEAGHAGGGGSGHTTAKVDATDDLRKWQRKALARAGDGRAPQVRFESDALDPAAYVVIYSRLGAAQDAAGVRAVFAPYLSKAAPRRDTLQRRIAGQVREWIEENNRQALAEVEE